MPEAESPDSLASTVILDPNFTFATSRLVRLELLPINPAAPAKSVEVSDAEGRRLLKGAFAGPISLALKLPVGAARQLKVRLADGASVTEVDVALDDSGLGSASY